MDDNRKRSKSGKPVVIDLLDSDSESENESNVRNDNTRMVASKKQRRETLEERNRKMNSKPSASSSSSNNKSNSTSAASLPNTTTQNNNSGNQRTNFCVATYNVWFGAHNLPDCQPYPQERMLALSQALLQRNTTGSCPLWFIGFQEVTYILYAMLRPVLESAGYKLFCQDFGANYGCAMAILQSPGCGLKILQHGFQPYSVSVQGRGFLHVRAQLPQSTKQVLFTTTHLESYMSREITSSAERAIQIKELETLCSNNLRRHPEMSLAFISGDLNWDDERVQSSGEDRMLLSLLSSKEWTDSWLPIRDRRRRAAADRNGRVRKKDEPMCYTYDPKANPMMSGSLRRRFDRILIRHQNGLRTTVEDIELIGKERIGTLTYTKQNMWQGKVTGSKVMPVCPSDHFGYVAKVNVHGL